MPATIDFELSLEEQCEAIWAATRAAEQAEINSRKIEPVARLWDGEMRLQHLVQAEYAASFELIDGDTGPFEIRHPFDHPTGQWLWDEWTRIQSGEKRSVNVTVDYAESRLGGLMEHCDLEPGDDGEQVVVARFSSDYERLKWYTCVAGDTMVTVRDQGYDVQMPIRELVGGPCEVVVDGRAYASEGAWSNGQRMVFTLTTSGGKRLTLTPSHELLTPDGFVPVREIGIGGTVLTVDGPEALVGYEYAGVVEVFDIDVPGVKRFAANGVLAHNCWANPWFPEWFQFPRIFVLPGPITWILPTTLDFQLHREMASGWTLTSDPMDPAQRAGLDQSTWSMVCKPISFMAAMASGVLWGIVASRFKNFHDIQKAMMQDGEITCLIKPFLDGDPEPWDGAGLRHGTRVVEWVDNSGSFSGTAHGGTVWDGLARTVTEFVGGFFDTDEALSGDTSIPPEYYEPGAAGKRTRKQLPFAVWRDGEESGLEFYRLRNTPSKGVQVVTGGHSMPGVNELMSAMVQLAFDMLAAAVFVPPLGGAVDALLSPLYTDTVAAWMVARLPGRATKSGWTRYFEYFQEGSGKAYTISALMVLRAGIWATRSFQASEFSAVDAAPFLIGETGHVWLGDRAGYTVRGDRSGRIYIDRVSKIKLAWDRQSKPEPTLTIGDSRALQDPFAKSWDKIEAMVSSLQQLGV